MNLYKPSKCSMEECANPFKCCRVCEQCLDSNPKTYWVYAFPHEHYQRMRGLNQ